MRALLFHPEFDLADTVTWPRRRLLGGALGLGLAAALGGCAGADGERAGGTGESSAPATRTVTTGSGPVEIPAAPRRIVAVGYDTPFQLRAVGVTPAGIFDYSRWYDQYPADDVAFLKQVPAIGQWGEPDLEKVAALDPDLIVGVHDELEADVAAKLAKVAPTALFATKTRGDRQTMSASIAEAANAADALTGVKRAYEDKVATLSRSYAAALKNNAWVHYSFGDSDGQFSVQFPTGATGALLQTLGAHFANVVSTAQPEAGYKSYSVEKADILSDATVGLFPLDAAGKEYPALATTRSSGIWRTLPFHRDGRDFGLVLLTGVNTYTSAVAALDELETKVLRQLP